MWNRGTVVVAAAALTVALAGPALADWGTPSVTSSVSTGFYPMSVTLTPDQSRLLVTDFLSDYVSILDTSSMSGTTLATNVGPWDIAVNPSGSRAWLSEYGTGSSGNTVAEIDLTATPPVVLRRLTVGNGPMGVAVTPNGNEVWVANFSLTPFTNASVSIINAAASPPVVATTLTGMGDNPSDIAFNGDGTRALVTSYTGTPNVRLVDVATRAVVGSISVGSGGLESVVFSSDGTRAWVAGGNQVHLLSISGNTITLVASATSNGASRVALSPDGGRVWVNNYFGSTVNILDALTLTPASGSPLTVGTYPIGITFSANGTTAYVANSSSNTLSVVSTGWIPGGDPSQYPTAPEQAFAVPFGTAADQCGALAPDSVDWPGIRHLRTQSWSISYAQWPNDHQGGWVCTRQPYWNGAGWAIR